MRGFQKPGFFPLSADREFIGGREFAISEAGLSLTIAPTSAMMPA
jgi:hypothetical protein